MERGGGLALKTWKGSSTNRISQHYNLTYVHRCLERSSPVVASSTTELDWLPPRGTPPLPRHLPSTSAPGPSGLLIVDSLAPVCRSAQAALPEISLHHVQYRLPRRGQQVVRHMREPKALWKAHVPAYSPPVVPNPHSPPAAGQG